jgi:hypothetical protein
MKKHDLVHSIIILLLLWGIGSGAWAVAEEKKTFAPPPANVQQGCPGDDQETPSCSSSASPLFDITENNTSHPDPKFGPSSTFKAPSARAIEEAENDFSQRR